MKNMHCIFVGMLSWWVWRTNQWLKHPRTIMPLTYRRSLGQWYAPISMYLSLSRNRRAPKTLRMMPTLKIVPSMATKPGASRNGPIHGWAAGVDLLLFSYHSCFSFCFCFFMSSSSLSKSSWRSSSSWWLSLSLCFFPLYCVTLILKSIRVFTVSHCADQQDHEHFCSSTKRLMRTFISAEQARTMTWHKSRTSPVKDSTNGPTADIDMLLDGLSFRNQHHSSLALSLVVPCSNSFSTCFFCPFVFG